MTVTTNNLMFREKARMVAIQEFFRLKGPQVALAVLSAAHFSKLLTSRFLFGTGLAPAEIKTLLSNIHSLKQWPRVWSEAAQRKVRESSLPTQNVAVAHKLEQAALFYHYAQIVLGRADLPKKLAYQQKTQELYRQAAPYFTLPAERVEIPFQAVKLPGYLRRPKGQARAIVVFLNGAGTVKEEFHRLSNVFLVNGYATLAFDDPGAGEAWPRLKGNVEQKEVAKAVLDHLRQARPALPERTVFFGVSLGGMKVLQMATAEPRISAVVSVSAPFDGQQYFQYLNPFIQDELGFYLGYPDLHIQKKLVCALALDETAKLIRVPTFIAGGRHDTILPYREAERIYRALPRTVDKTLKTYDASHICLDRFSELAADVLAWLPYIL